MVLYKDMASIDILTRFIVEISEIDHCVADWRGERFKLVVLPGPSHHHAKEQKVVDRVQTACGSGVDF